MAERTRSPEIQLAMDGVDIDALRHKYARERDRRRRADGIQQYIEVTGRFARFGQDPWADPGFRREPRTDDVDVALVGAGLGGLLTGARLREQGVGNVRLIDKAADVGGTWYWNRYPGLACDVESYVYLPLLEELGYLPTEKYASGAEIFAHCRRIAEHYDLYRNALLHTEVREIRWAADDSRWHIMTDRGDVIRARFVSMATGYLDKPKLPGIDGIDSFGGHMFHAGRWDYGYTGLDLEGLADKRVGIIGTGATAVQCVPHVARAARQLLVFQRTPSSVDVRANRSTDPQWAAALGPGWQRRRIENFQILSTGGQATEDLVADGWTRFSHMLQAALNDPTAGFDENVLELVDFARMGEIRSRIDAVVTNQATATALKPWYDYFCKRPCFHDEYLSTFNRDNVALVDTRGRGVERITEAGVIVDGVLYELDCLIFATGFEVGTGHARRTGFEVIGRDGVTLTEAWGDGVRTFQGVCVHGFPNLFIESIAQAGLTVNFPYLLDVQARHVAWIINWALRRGATEIEAAAYAEDEWVKTIEARAAAFVERFQTCTPGYFNLEGQVGTENLRGSCFLGYPTEYEDILAAWRTDDTLAGMRSLIPDDAQ